MSNQPQGISPEDAKAIGAAIERNKQEIERLQNTAAELFQKAPSLAGTPLAHDFTRVAGLFEKQNQALIAARTGQDVADATKADVFNEKAKLLEKIDFALTVRQVTAEELQHRNPGIVLNF